MMIMVSCLLDMDFLCDLCFVVLDYSVLSHGLDFASSFFQYLFVGAKLPKLKCDVESN